MRIVLVNKFWYPKGGSERYTFLLRDLLESHGHSVVPFSMEDDRNLPTPWSEHFVPHVDFWDAADAVPGQTHVLQKLSRVLWSRDAAQRFGEFLDAVQPDIVHLQNFAHQISPSILPECTKRGIPAVWTLHDYKAMCPNYRMYTRGAPCERCKGGRYWNAVRFSCMGSRGASLAVALEMTLHHAILDVYGKHLAAVIAPSQFMAEQLRAWGWKGRVEMVPPCITLDVGDQQRDQALGMDHHVESRSVLFIGRLVEEKGIEDFLAVAKLHPDIPFEVIGDGPLMERCSLSAATCTNVRLRGALPPHATAIHIAQAAIVVVPSRWYENAPYVVLEAMAAGVPIIAADIGGLPELVRHGENGLLVPPRDAAALDTSIAMLYRDEVKRTAMGAQARTLVREQYGAEQHYQLLNTLYRDCIARR